MSAPNPVTTPVVESRLSARSAYEYRNQYFAQQIARAIAQLKDTFCFPRTAEG